MKDESSISDCFYTTLKFNILFMKNRAHYPN